MFAEVVGNFIAYHKSSNTLSISCEEIRNNAVVHIFFKIFVKNTPLGDKKNILLVVNKIQCL